MPKHSRKKAGLPPGSVIFLGNRKVETVRIHYLHYNAQEAQEQDLDNQSRLDIARTENGQIHWYDIRGLHDTHLIEEIGRVFEIHPLVLEDITDTETRPKFEEYGNGNFIIGRAIKYDPDVQEVSAEQIGIYFGKDFVISFQENEDDLFTSVRTRLLRARGKIRQRGADYLAYALLDYVVDQYYLVMEELEKEIELMENDVLSDPSESARSSIHNFRQEINLLRKTITPMRDAVNLFSRAENEFISEVTHVFLRDLYDHTVQIMDLSDTYREMLHGLHDLYMSEINFRLNNVIQILTIITTIFVPLSFLASLYGMNFHYMPELEWRYGYFILLGIMGAVAVSLLIYFRKKGWL